MIHIFIFIGRDATKSNNKIQMIHTIILNHGTAQFPDERSQLLEGTDVKRSDNKVVIRIVSK